MKLRKLFISSSLLLTSLLSNCGLNVINIEPAQAGFWEGLDPTNPKNRISPLINFKICNYTGQSFSYTLNGSTQRANNNTCTKYTKWPTGTVVGFDFSPFRGYQDKRYKLNHGASYYFTKKRDSSGREVVTYFYKN